MSLKNVFGCLETSGRRMSKKNFPAWLVDSNKPYYVTPQTLLLNNPIEPSLLRNNQSKPSLLRNRLLYLLENIPYCITCTCIS